MRCLSILIALVLCTPTFAQPLADRVPAGTMVYFGWRGTNDLGPGYAGSRMEAIAKESSFAKLIDETLPAAVLLHQKKNPNVAKALATAQVFVKQLVRYPTAFYFAGMNEDGKTPKLGFVCRAGAESEKLLAELEKLTLQAPRSAKIKSFAAGDVVAVTIGYEPDEMALAGGEGRPGAIADDAGFKAALAKVDADPVFVIYVNGKAIAQLVKQSAAAGAGEQNSDKIVKAIDEAGFANFGTVICSGTFKGRNWQESVFVEAPSPRKGFVGLLDAKPFNDDLLARVPASATFVSATRLDLAKGVGEIKRVAMAVDPQWGDIVNKGFAAAKIAVFGKDIQDDILEPLGDEWVIYNSPEIAGMDLQGMVLVNKLDNPMKAKQSLTSLSIFISNTAQTFTARQDLKLGIANVKVGDTTIYYCATPLVAPAWAIKDGYLYAGLYPQTVAAAVGYSGKSIKENAKFAETMTKLEQTNVVSMRYDDVEAYMPFGYATVQMLVRTGLGLSDMFAAPTPEMMLPPLPTILANSAPAGEVMWVDDAGIHGKTVMPFPGATTMAELSLTSLYTANPALMASILLPSLNRAQEAANRIKSASNLKQIGLAMKMYANDDVRNGNRYPPNFDELLKTQDITPDVFDSPLGDAPGGDYVYLVYPGLNDSVAADIMIAFDKAALDQGEGTNVLYADGHVDWVTAEAFWREVDHCREIEPKSCPKALLGGR